jgi:hypothetical protein
VKVTTRKASPDITESLNPRNSKPISLHPLKPEDAIRAALMTPPPLSEKKPKRKKTRKAI